MFVTIVGVLLALIAAALVVVGLAKAFAVGVVESQQRLKADPTYLRQTQYSQERWRWLWVAALGLVLFAIGLQMVWPSSANIMWIGVFGAVLVFCSITLHEIDKTLRLVKQATSPPINANN